MFSDSTKFEYLTTKLQTYTKKTRAQFAKVDPEDVRSVVAEVE